MQRLRDQDVMLPCHFKELVQGSFKNILHDELGKV
jgi:hypothetical protein